MPVVTAESQSRRKPGRPLLWAVPAGILLLLVILAGLAPPFGWEYRWEDRNRRVWLKAAITGKQDLAPGGFWRFRAAGWDYRGLRLGDWVWGVMVLPPRRKR